MAAGKKPGTGTALSCCRKQCLSLKPGELQQGPKAMSAQWWGLKSVVAASMATAVSLEGRFSIPFVHREAVAFLVPSWNFICPLGGGMEVSL